MLNLSDLTKLECHKTKHYLIFWQQKEVKINIWNWVLKAIFYFTVSFLRRNTVSLQSEYRWNKFKHSFFYPSLLSKFETEHCQPQTCWCCVGCFAIYFIYLRLPILNLILNSYNRIFRLCMSLKATCTFSHQKKNIYI